MKQMNRKFSCWVLPQWAQFFRRKRFHLESFKVIHKVGDFKVPKTLEAAIYRLTFHIMLNILRLF